MLLPMIKLTPRALMNFSFKQFNFTNHLRISCKRLMSSGESVKNSDDCVTVTFLKADGEKVTVRSSTDKTLYDAVIDNNVDIDGFGACEGTLCCTTCHLIFKQSDYEKIGEPSDEELDMLDLAYGLSNTSRLGCQVHLKKELDPLEVCIPASINDVRDG